MALVLGFCSLALESGSGGLGSVVAVKRLKPIDSVIDQNSSRRTYPQVIAGSQLPLASGFMSLTDSVVL